MNPSLGVKEDFEPEVSNNIEQANEAGKLAFAPAFAAHISLFPAALFFEDGGGTLCSDRRVHLRFKIWGILYLASTDTGALPTMQDPLKSKLSLYFWCFLDLTMKLLGKLFSSAV